MIETLDKVIHFEGPISKWNETISHGDWENCIVFGYITDEEGKKVQRMYAGRNSRQRDFEYKTAVNSTSRLAAEQYTLLPENFGLIINIFNSQDEAENGSYLVGYTLDGADLQLIKIEDDWDDIIDVSEEQLENVNE